MTNRESAQDRVRRYFRVRTRQLRAAVDLPVAEHSGLVGGHREEFQRIYLRDILPKRFEVGRGMVYGPLHRSREADLVVWDSQNFPSLPALDHSFYFAESVRLVLESKSRWSAEEFRDVLDKCRAVRNIIVASESTLDDVLAMLQLDIAALRAGVEHQGIMRSVPHIGTASVFLSGGSKAFRFPSDIAEEWLRDVDDEWPDVVLLLETGCLVIKDYSGESGGRLLFFNLGEDALLLFTNAILRLIADRSVSVEAHFYFEKYAIEAFQVDPYMVVPFPLTRLPPQRTPIWG